MPGLNLASGEAPSEELATTELGGQPGCGSGFYGVGQGDFVGENVRDVGLAIHPALPNNLVGFKLDGESAVLAKS